MRTLCLNSIELYAHVEGGYLIPEKRKPPIPVFRNDFDSFNLVFIFLGGKVLNLKGCFEGGAVGAFLAVRAYENIKPK